MFSVPPKRPAIYYPDRIVGGSLGMQILNNVFITILLQQLNADRNGGDNLTLMYNFSCYNNSYFPSVGLVVTQISSF